MAKKWSSENIIYFLDVYKNYDSLWNIRSPNYRNRTLRSEVFDELITELREVFPSITPKLLKMKIKTIKNVVNQELEKIAKNLRLGIVYVPRLSWFQAAEYLQDCVIKRDPSAVKTSAQKKYEPEVFDICEEHGETETNPNKKLRVAKRERSPSTEVENFEDPLSNCAMVEESSIRDECSVFGEHIAHRLRNITDRHTRLLAEHKIHTALFEIEMKNFKETEVNY